MRVVICWPVISGYFAACARALAKRPDMDLFVVAFRDPGTATAFDAAEMDGVPCRLLEPQECDDAALIESLVLAHKPDAISIPGWSLRAFRELVRNPKIAGVRKIMTMDTPWRFTARKFAAAITLRSFVKSLDGVVVAGERSWQYARVLGVPEAKLSRGVYACDFERFQTAATKRRDAGAWPRAFLYTGRYAPEKGLDTLLQAYARYRAEVSDPWPLTCCGKGALGSMVQSAQGVVDRGFVLPADLPDVMAAHGAFILPSLYEPWGVVIAEAASAALPIICTEACGASVELVRSQFNGLTIATGDVAALTRALRWVHDHEAELPEMGRRGQALAEAFSADMWARRWAALLAAPQPT